MIQVVKEYFLSGESLSGMRVLDLFLGIICCFDALVSLGNQVFDPGSLDVLLLLYGFQAVCHRLVRTEEVLRPLLGRVDILQDSHEAESLPLVTLMRLVQLNERLLQGDKAGILILDTRRVVLHSEVQVLLQHFIFKF